METAGYSSTPLAKKLGIKPGFRVSFIDEPGYYLKLFSDLPDDLIYSHYPDELKNFIHFFVRHKDDYFDKLPKLKAQMVQNGCIWVSWPKKSSKVPTDITENIIRNFALQTGLVDVKVCAVDETWSGLKLVIRVVDRV